MSYNFVRWFVAVCAMIIFASCFGGGSSDEASLPEEPVVENRVYGILADGYTLQNNHIEQGEAMGTILGRYGVSAHTTYLLDQASKPIYPLNKIKSGNSYTTFVRRDSLDTEHLDYLVYDIDQTHYVVFSVMPDSIYASKGERPTTVKRVKRSAVIKSSMWGAIMEAEMPYALGSEIEDIFQWTVDFFAINMGDKFTVIYEERFVDDTIPVGMGRVLGAKFTHANRDYYAIPFRQGDKLQYWEEDGGSLRKQMLKAPLKYTRISSGFSYARFHPIHKVYKPHTGVDYAAPMGTPVHSVADGVVTFRGWGGGGGNTIKIKHPGGFTTGYLHLKGYATGITVGAIVKQGQTIGYVGSTGDSTGPHLDYRIWKGGVPINPLKVPQEPTEPISNENMKAFELVKNQIMAELNGEANRSFRVFDLKNLIYPDANKDSDSDEMN